MVGEETAMIFASPGIAGSARRWIGNRMLFGGNLLRQPVVAQLRQDQTEVLRVIGEMCGSDEIMSSTLFLWSHRGLTGVILTSECKTFQRYTCRKIAPAHQARKFHESVCR